MGRDMDIGIPPEGTTLKDIHNKLDEVKKKVNDVSNEIDETNEELKKIKTGTGLSIGVDLDEEVV